MSYNTRETSEIRVSSKIDRTALTETLFLKSKVLYTDGQNIFDILLQHWFKNNTKRELNTCLLSPPVFSYFSFYVISIGNRLGPSKIHDF